MAREDQDDIPGNFVREAAFEKVASSSETCRWLVHSVPGNRSMYRDLRWEHPWLVSVLAGRTGRGCS